MPVIHDDGTLCTCKPVPPVQTKKRWICIDPGEDTGFSIWEGKKLIIGGTVKLWDVADLIGRVLGVGVSMPAYGEEYKFLEDELLGYEIERIVCEDFRIYPWEARNLAWDQVRTARLIGAITWCCRTTSTKFILQPAAIKDGAVKGGAENFFYTPLRENRHINDSIMHGWFYVQAVMHGNERLLVELKALPGPSNNEQEGGST